MNPETIRIAETLARSLAALGSFDHAAALAAVHSLAVALCRKMGGSGEETGAVFLLSSTEWDEARAIAVVRKAAARRRAQESASAQKGSRS